MDADERRSRGESITVHTLLSEGYSLALVYDVSGSNGMAGEG